MKCPVCDNTMTATVCACGYDASRDYGRYPGFGLLPEGVQSVSGLRDSRLNLLQCAGCGGRDFRLRLDSGLLVCARCAQALTAEQLLPLRKAMGWEKAAPKEERNVTPLVSVLSQAAEKKKKMEAVDRALSQIAQKVYAEKAEREKKRIVALAAGEGHTVALYGDGTVGAIGENRGGQCNVSSWRNIVAISAGWNHTIGLRKDGTVVVAGPSYGDRNMATVEWNGITAVADGTFHSLGLTSKGTVVSSGDKTKGKRDLSSWHGIKKIAAGNTHSVGLQHNGSVVVAGKGKWARIPGTGWWNMTDIAAGEEFTVGLRSDGLVEAVGNNCEGVETWRDISAIAAGNFHVVGLRKDGTAVATGHNFDGRCNLDAWKDLTAVAAGRYHTIGLKKDGTLVAAGANKSGQCDVHKLIRA